MPERRPDTIPECPIPVIQPHQLVPDVVIAYIDIRIAIAVQIGYRYTQPSAVLDDPRLLRYILIDRRIQSRRYTLVMK